MHQKDSNNPGGGSTMAEPLSDYPWMVGLNPTADTGGEQMGKKVYYVKVTELVYATKRFQ
jgi:hypothetical protein